MGSGSGVSVDRAPASSGTGQSLSNARRLRAWRVGHESWAQARRKKVVVGGCVFMGREDGLRRAADAKMIQLPI